MLSAAADSRALALSYAEALDQAILPKAGNLNGEHLYAWADKARTKEFGDRVTKRQLLEVKKRETSGLSEDDLVDAEKFAALHSYYTMTRDILEKQH